MNKKLIAAMAAVAAVGTVIFFRKRKKDPGKAEPAGIKRTQKHRIEATSRPRNHGGKPKSELDII